MAIFIFSSFLPVAVPAALVLSAEHRKLFLSTLVMLITGKFVMLLLWFLLQMVIERFSYVFICRPSCSPRAD